ncbi:MAG: hypothetical protein HQ582_02760 [Planctomycetes bacterium]|nr:hypothetical protein [Planctomycetota bacterium]
MATGERILLASGSKQRSPEEHSPAPRDSCRTLIADGPWDSYDLASLLPLKEVVRENTEFGFLLRHYWIPATVLTFRQSSRTPLSDGTVQQCELEIERRMARCRSNECLWREKIRQVGPGKDSGERSDVLISEMLCSYDCYEQTYASAEPVLFAPPTADQKEEARRQALCRLPMLVPPGPVPIGFSWYGKVGDDYMNYRLEAEEQVGETSVLVIRREGRYTRWLPEEAMNSGIAQQTTPVVAERQGVTLFAWDRGTVLEDRFMEYIVDGGERSASRVGMANQVVTRLVRSCPGE